MKSTKTLAVLALAGLASACATAPQPVPAAAGADCAQIQARLAQSEQLRREAQQQKQDAWKVIVPFAVAARHAQAGKALDAAEQQQAALQAAAQKQGCSHGA
jgi:hypothetical protein